MRCILVHISIVFFKATFEANIDGEYLYDEDVMGAIKSSNRSESGSRLIGARSAKAPSEAPFVVAIGRVSCQSGLPLCMTLMFSSLAPRTSSV